MTNQMISHMIKFRNAFHIFNYLYRINKNSSLQLIAIYFIVFYNTTIQKRLFILWLFFNNLWVKRRTILQNLLETMILLLTSTNESTYNKISNKQKIYDNYFSIRMKLIKLESERPIPYLFDILV